MMRESWECLELVMDVDADARVVAVVTEFEEENTSFESKGGDPKG